MAGKAAKFTPFPEPKLPDDKPLVQHAGVDYRCSGCGGSVADGVWILPNVRNGMVVGVRVQRGADGPVEHECGEPPDVG
jgi:hypothetical protein